MNSRPHFLQRIVEPHSSSEDVRRREFILNILLISCVTLLAFALLLQILYHLSGSHMDYQRDTLEFSIVFGMMFYMLVLYTASRRGYVTVAAYFLVCSVFLLPVYLGLRWGVNLPPALVFYPLVIVMAGVLVSTRFAFVMTLATAAALLGIWYVQAAGILPADQSWVTEKWVPSDVIIIVLIYTVTVTVSWLSNREIEHSLIRARNSEVALKHERDTLEIRVEERTKALRAAEMEKISQAYRFVEFGRLASGLFHDLMSPLTALSLNIESIATSQGAQDPTRIERMSRDVTHAQSATTHIQKLVESLRRHIAREGSQEVFAVNETIEEVASILNSYARQNQATVYAQDLPSVSTYGDPVAFSQVITNIISNAIEAEAKEVRLTLSEGDRRICVGVQDTGRGIAPDVLSHIFEPFFSTKGPRGGLGIGLASAKRIIEKEFGGTIDVQSSVGEGSTFTIYFPIREP